MYYPNVETNGNTRFMVDSWLGYNHNLKINNGEFYDMENMSTDLYPLLSPRQIRTRLYDGIEYLYDENNYPIIEDGKHKFIEHDVKGILVTEGNLTFLENQKLHYGSRIIDVSDLIEEDAKEQQLIRFGAYIIMFPANAYINVHNTVDRGFMAASHSVSVGKRITFTICQSDGNEYENISASKDAPTGASTGDYWIKTLKGEEGLYIWNGDSWDAVATSYIKISIPGESLTEYFSEGDVVFMNSLLKDINNGSQIEAIGDEYIVVMGIMDEPQKTFDTSSSWQLTFERKIPKLDYICADKNRLWGCYFGYDVEKKAMINEIYCSKLGDFKNWYTYQGLASDSYAVTVGIPEVWTGCISYQGYPTFFKENAIYRIFGSMPSNFQVNQIDARGVQRGSDKSLAIVDEVLVYKSSVDVCAFDGSRPTSISDKLGRERYYSAIGSGCLGKYRVEMETELGHKRFFIYDFKTGLWSKEEALNVKMFSGTENGQLFAATKTDIYGLGNPDNVAYLTPAVSEEYVTWSAETGDMGYEFPDYKYVSRLTLRAKVPTRSEVKVSISYNDGIWNEVGILRGRETTETQSLGINPLRCDHYRLKFEGHGNCIIYSLAITYDTESEEDGY